jgi:hypothetical protein
MPRANPNEGGHQIIWPKVILTLGLAVATIGSPADQKVSWGQPSASNRTPSLLNTCVITANIRQLVEFYESVLGLKAVWSSDDYAEFHTGVGVLAVFSSSAQEKYIPELPLPGKTEAWFWNSVFQTSITSMRDYRAS